MTSSTSNKKRREQSSRRTDTTTTKWAQPPKIRGNGRNGRERKTKLKSQRRYQSILKRARAFWFHEVLSLSAVFFERTRVVFQRSDQEQDKENTKKNRDGDYQYHHKNQKALWIPFPRASGRGASSEGNKRDKQLAAMATRRENALPKCRTPKYPA